MILSSIWAIATLVLAYLYFQQCRTQNVKFIDSLRLALVRHNTKDDWFGILFLVFLLIAPLVVGFSFYLKSDANVVVVLAFLIWIYQWIKAIWNSSVETE
ncbi:MAG: hypothetical protein GW938_10475 [Leptospira sp.]|nr:hypothetical protein [Leptospira sp.]NCS95149.1 hypothetical protein [Leptospira sp.]